MITCRESETGESGFPGLIAPASLKHRHSGRRHVRAGGFSGVNRPGLIEAKTKVPFSITGDIGFPGLIAPASLKLPQRPYQRRIVVVVFRG